MYYSVYETGPYIQIIYYMDLAIAPVRGLDMGALREAWGWRGAASPTEAARPRGGVVLPAAGSGEVEAARRLVMWHHKGGTTGE